jgi:hypothetical protein
MYGDQLRAYRGEEEEEGNSYYEVVENFVASFCIK